jgi:hypothetical protein
MDTTKVLFDTSNFWTVNWYYFAALFVAITSATIAWKNYKKKPAISDKRETDVKTNNNNSSAISNPVITINNHILGTTKENKTIQNSSAKTNGSLKDTTQILFVDDNHTEYKTVSLLKTGGWVKTKSVKDIIDLDAQIVKESQIIFVDINGVGKKLFKDEGLGLASALKAKYPHKKIVIYSTETSGDRFHKAFREVDDFLWKNAEPYEFFNLVDNLAKEI